MFQNLLGELLYLGSDEIVPCFCELAASAGGYRNITIRDKDRSQPHSYTAKIRPRGEAQDINSGFSSLVYLNMIKLINLYKYYSLRH